MRTLATNKGLRALGQGLSPATRQLIQKSIGFGFYLSWQRSLSFNTLFYNRYDGEILGMSISELSSMAQSMLITILFLLAVILLPIRHLPLNARKSMYVAAVLVAAAGTIISAQNTSLLAFALIRPVLTGLGEVLMILMWGEYCSSIGLRKTGLLIPVASLLGVGFSYLAMFASGVIALLLIAAYPVASVLLLLWGRKESVQFCRAVVKSSTERVFPKIWGSGLWKIFLSLAVLGFSVNLARYSMESVGLAVVRDHNTLMSAYTAMALLMLAGVALLKKKSRLVIIVDLVIVIMALGNALILFVGPSQAFLVSFLLTSGKSGLYLLSWIIFSDVTHSLHIPATKVFGLGNALAAAGGFFGTFVGSLIMMAPLAGDVLLMGITVANMFLLIVSAAFLLSGFTKACNLEPLSQTTDTVEGQLGERQLGERQLGERQLGERHPEEIAREYSQNSHLESPMEASNHVKQAMEAIALGYGLTSREKQIATLLVRGRSLPYIEKSLNISHSTANTHAQNIYRKLGIHSRQELLDIFNAVEQELLSVISHEGEE